jgi:hypothetical protein
MRSRTPSCEHADGLRGNKRRHGDAIDRVGTTGIDTNTVFIGQGAGVSYLGNDEDGNPIYDYYWFIDESFLSFDTSSLGTGATVSSAVLRLTSTGDYSTQDFTAQARLRDWGTTLEIGDFLTPAGLSGCTLLAHYATSGGWTSGTGYDFVDDAMAANVSKTGFTRMVLCSDRTASSTEPTQSENIAAYTSEVAGTTQDPKLTVTYTGGGAAEDIQPYVGAGYYGY